MTSWRRHTGDDMMTLICNWSALILFWCQRKSFPTCAVTHIAEQSLCRPAVTEYVAAAASKSDLERTDLSKQKTGVFTGDCQLSQLPSPASAGWQGRHVA